MKVWLKLPRAQRRRIERRARQIRDRIEWTRCQVILRLNECCSVTEITGMVGCVGATVYRTLYRLKSKGKTGWPTDGWDVRRGRSRPSSRSGCSVTWTSRLWKLGWQRSTWTLELLALQLERDTSVKLSASHVRNLLKAHHCRPGVHARRFGFQCAAGGKSFKRSSVWSQPPVPTKRSYTLTRSTSTSTRGSA